MWLSNTNSTCTANGPLKYFMKYLTKPPFKLHAHTELANLETNNSYLLSERMRSPSRAENNLGRDEHGDLSYWADLGELGEEDFTEESIKRELEEAKKRLLEELHSPKNEESEE